MFPAQRDAPNDSRLNIMRRLAFHKQGSQRSNIRTEKDALRREKSGLRLQ